MDLIQVSPDKDLIFRGPYDQPCSTTMTITNRSSQNVLYKVKTTAPKCYCVRPNAAVIGPKLSATVSVILQPNASEPVTDQTRHRFMVQSVAVGDSVPTDIDQHWKQMTQESAQGKDLKLRVVFEGLTSSGTTESTKQLPEEAYATLGGGSGSLPPSFKSSASPSAKPVSKTAPPQKDEGPRHRPTAPQLPSAAQSSVPSTGLSSQAQAQPQSSLSTPVLLLLLLLYSLLLLGAGYAIAKYV